VRACVRAWEDQHGIREIAYYFSARHDEIAHRRLAQSDRVRCQCHRQSHDQNWQSARGPRPFPGLALPVPSRPSPLVRALPFRHKKNDDRSRTCVHMGLASLCISNRTHFVNLALRNSVYGSSGHTFRSSSTSTSPTSSSSSTSTSTSTTPSTFAYPWRHASWSRRFRTSPFCSPTHHARLYSARAASWAAKFNLRPSPRSFNDVDTHEEAAQAAVLEAIKGRQQTDLMLRCESPAPHHHPPHCRFANSLTDFIST